ncbi:hypothetical protein B5M47_02690 [candidate division CPR3 bacterium 4484_211]|uniref:Isoprenylcysteine carboxylmethyltransferase family protein n=1 Tax=candidate division CPR3 bacterium 4484_211 TaxID=1968527 RepID=A0A1W9NY26_UNCC3|nr:MAG: hypothetical protein B5M47_02690 [candidate division CPR3 bacterium 4484_211]
MKVLKTAGKILGLFWYMPFFAVIIPWLVLQVGYSLDWLIFEYFLKIDQWHCAPIPLAEQLLQFFGFTSTALGITILVKAWSDLAGEGKFFPLTIISREHLRPQKLVTTGIYSKVRHPMLLGYLTILAGLGILNHSLSTVFWLIPLAGYTAVRFLEDTEEKELTIWFGEEYRKYKKKVPALIPELFRKNEKTD